VPPALRPYQPDDFETLFKIDKACYPPRIAYSRRELRAFLGDPGAECVVAEVENQIAGFIIAEAEARPQRAITGHIITIDVLEPYRRSGIGSLLISAAEERMAARGAKQVELETARNNDAAIAFWQKHGYRTRGVYEHYYPGGMDAFSMVKSLRSDAQADANKEH
jgi:[ribosomal protein S18]-alanine N-acetyltransferase